MQSRPRRTRRGIVPLVVLVAVASALVSPTGCWSSLGEGTRSVVGPGVCVGVTGCHVKARADVNGDGSADAIGVARRGASGAPSGAVLVRVKVGPNRIASYLARTEYWYGPVWQGVARLGGGAN